MNSLVTDSESYKVLSSLFEDFEIINKLAKQRMAENNSTASMRCILIMQLIIDELKNRVL